MISLAIVHSVCMQAGGPAIIASLFSPLGVSTTEGVDRYSYQSPDPNRAVLREGVRAGGFPELFDPESLSQVYYSLLVVVLRHVVV